MSAKTFEEWIKDFDLYHYEYLYGNDKWLFAQAFASAHHASTDFYSTGHTFDMQCELFFGVTFQTYINWFKYDQTATSHAMRLRILNWCKKHLETLV